MLFTSFMRECTSSGYRGTVVHMIRISVQVDSFSQSQQKCDLFIYMQDSGFVS